MGRLGFLAGVVGCLLTASLLGGRTPLEAQDREALVAQGGQLFANKGCYGCHTIGAVGTPIGPDLRTAVRRQGEGTLARWLLDPSAQEPTRHMPDLRLTEGEAHALAAYLASLP